MAWHGKSYNIFLVFSYLDEAWTLREPIFGLVMIFKGVAIYLGEDKWNLDFRLKIKSLSQILKI